MLRMNFKMVRIYEMGCNVVGSLQQKQRSIKLTSNTPLLCIIVFYQSFKFPLLYSHIIMIRS